MATLSNNEGTPDPEELCMKIDELSNIPQKLFTAMDASANPTILLLIVMPDGRLTDFVIDGNLQNLVLSNLCDDDGNRCAPSVDGAGLFQGGEASEILSRIFDMPDSHRERCVLDLVVPYNTTEGILIPSEAQDSFCEMIQKALPLVAYLQQTDNENASKSKASILEDFKKDCKIVVSYRQADISPWLPLLITVSVDYHLPESQIGEHFSPALNIGLPMTLEFLRQIDVNAYVTMALESGGLDAAHALSRWKMAQSVRV